LYVKQYATGVSAAGQEPVVLVGYSNIQAQGGNGATAGGNGGSFYAEVDFDYYGDDVSDDYDYYEYYYYYENSHAGSVENQAAFDGRGGNGGNGPGGDAGDFEMYTPYYVIPPFDFGARNSGDVNLSGGNGTDGGDAGWVEIYGKYYATNTGNFTMVGGNRTTEDGGYASSFYLYCDGGTTLNTGTLTSRGGGSTSGIARDGGSIWLAGSRVVNSGSIASNGGNSTSGTAGNGGDIELYSQDYPTQTSLSSLNVNPGTGPVSGSKGTIWIDGIQVVVP
jgi:hypothetical protein